MHSHSVFIDTHTHSKLFHRSAYYTQHTQEYTPPTSPSSEWPVFQGLASPREGAHVPGIFINPQRDHNIH